MIELNAGCLTTVTSVFNYRYKCFQLPLKMFLTTVENVFNYRYNTCIRLIFSFRYASLPRIGDTAFIVQNCFSWTCKKKSFTV